MLMWLVGRPLLVLALTGFDSESSGVVFSVCKLGMFKVRLD